jgi:hypothetical protein
MKRFALKGAVFGGAVLLSLLAAELVVRAVQPQELVLLNIAEILRPDDTFGWRHRENISLTVNTGEGPVVFATDAEGYRVAGGAQPDRHNDADISILVIGDSFLEALAVEFDQTVPALLESHLSKAHSSPTVADNTAVGGWGPNHYYLEAKRALESRSYDVGLVFLYVGNDVITSRSNSFTPRSLGAERRFRVPTDLQWQARRNGVFYRINNLLETKSHLFLLVKHRLWTTLAQFGLTASYFPNIFQRSNEPADWWAITAETAKAIGNVFSDHGVPVTFVLIPSKYQVYEDVFYRYVQGFGIDVETVDLEQPNRLLKQEFRARDLVLMDLLEALRQHSGGRLYGSIDSHLNADGHRFIASYLRPHVESLLAKKVENFVLCDPEPPIH